MWGIRFSCSFCIDHAYLYVFLQKRQVVILEAFKLRVRAPPKTWIKCSEKEHLRASEPRLRGPKRLFSSPSQNAKRTWKRDFIQIRKLCFLCTWKQDTWTFGLVCVAVCNACRSCEKQWCVGSCVVCLYTWEASCTHLWTYSLHDPLMRGYLGVFGGS